MSITFGGHGIQPIDEVSGNAIYTSVTLDLSPTNVPDNNANKTQLLCVAGTVSPQSDGRIIYFRFKERIINYLELECRSTQERLQNRQSGLFVATRN